MKRTLTITTGKSRKDALRVAGQLVAHGVATGQYQGESLNFESPASFFGQLTELRWQMVREMMGSGTLLCPFDDIHVDMHVTPLEEVV